MKKGSGTTEPQRKEQNVARIAGVNIPTAKRVPIAL
ncbi:MAG: 30S ribosomal protein S13, partial [Rhodobacteraceae bacterium]|nr:30S ribosomal protein S13 [Paracoccaceae bacterium]